MFLNYIVKILRSYNMLYLIYITNYYGRVILLEDIHLMGK